ncbi:hypothetical protein IU429_02920 [Nocardia elegans]|uniref:Uncharacterized protein n=1 Tax=Nocardia elegans TaxID=300029 RepID=A0ABW6TN56_9NOCA|nr:hypothetical protein [Nocardia elegans]MBF6446612.1 hypothetical protein [Nocardia elegans]
MADNTARARKELEAARRAVSEHVDKWERYAEKYDKEFALKTITRVQVEIDKIKSKHPSLRDDSWEDKWKPRQ